MVDGETEEELSDNYRFVLSYNTDNEKPCYCKAEKDVSGDGQPVRQQPY